MVATVLLLGRLSGQQISHRIHPIFLNMIMLAINYSLVKQFHLIYLTLKLNLLLAPRLSKG